MEHWLLFNSFVEPCKLQICFRVLWQRDWSKMKCLRDPNHYSLFKQSNFKNATFASIPFLRRTLQTADLFSESFDFWWFQYFEMKMNQLALRIAFLAFIWKNIHIHENIFLPFWEGEWRWFSQSPKVLGKNKIKSRLYLEPHSLPVLCFCMCTTAYLPTAYRWFA